MRDLREKAEALIVDPDALEGRLEAAEVEELALRENLRLAEKRSESLRARLQEERTPAEPREEPQGPAWRRCLGGG